MMYKPKIKKLDYFRHGTSSNGIVSFDGMSINANNTKFDVGEVKAWFIDHSIDPGNPIQRFLVFPAQTAITPTHIATANGSFIGIDSTGTIIQQTTAFTNAQTRTILPLGGITHTNHTTVNAVNDAPLIEYNLGLQFYDLLANLGNFNISGNIFSSVGANLTIKKSAGTIFRKSDNYETDADDPHTISSASLNPVTFGYRNSTASFTGANTTNVDPSTYENPIGTNTSVGTNKFTIQRIWLAPNDQVLIQYGQTEYNTMATAIESLPNESYTANVALSQRALLRGFLVIRQGATDLSDTDEARFYANSRFADTATISATSVSTLQNAYDNSVTPEIVTDTSRGAVSVKRGSAADTDSVIEALNGAGSATASIKGNGNISGNVLTATATTGNALVVDTNTLVADATNNRVGIGTATPGARLDLGLSPSLQGNLQLASYGYFGLHYSSGALSMGYNAKARETGVADVTEVANTNAVVGYQYIKMDYTSGIRFHVFVGSVTAGDSASMERMRIGNNGEVIINDTGGADADLRVEGDTDANLLFTDASADMVGVGTNAPGTKLAVEGVISTKAGTSTGRIAKVGGKISSNTTAVGNVGTGEDDLMTYSVPANTLSTNQDSLTFRAVVVIASNINAKRVRVKFGATTIFDTGAAGIPISAAINMVVEGEIIRTGATSQLCNANISTDNGSLASYTGYATAAETLSGAVTLKITGEAVANDDISQKSMVVNWQPAP